MAALTMTKSRSLSRSWRMPPRFLYRQTPACLALQVAADPPEPLGGRALGLSYVRCIVAEG